MMNSYCKLDSGREVATTDKSYKQINIALYLSFEDLLDSLQGESGRWVADVVGSAPYPVWQFLYDVPFSQFKQHIFQTAPTSAAFIGVHRLTH